MKKLLKKTKPILTKSVKSLLSTKMVDSLFSNYRGDCICLMYHRVIIDKPLDNAIDAKLNISVSLENFENQIRYLSENFNCMGLPEAVPLIEKGKIPPKSIIITFDDGYKDNLSLALPILKKYQVAATIYITTGFIEREVDMWWAEIETIIDTTQEIYFSSNGKQYYWDVSTLVNKKKAYLELNNMFKSINLAEQHRIMEQLRKINHTHFNYDNTMLTWEEVELLDREPLITIGAHTHNHPVLSQLNEDEVVHEIKKSKNILQEHLNHPIDHFAYPFGKASEASHREYKAVRSAKLHSAFTTINAHIYNNQSKSMFSLPREYISYNLDMNMFKFMLGAFSGFRGKNQINRHN